GLLLVVNYLLTTDESQRHQIAKSLQNLKPVVVAIGYHNFFTIKAQEVFLGQGYPPGLDPVIQEAFRSEKINIKDYVDGDLMRDIIRQFGGKTGVSKPLIEILRQYLTFIYNFEMAQTREQLIEALDQLIGEYQSYKF